MNATELFAHIADAMDMPAEEINFPSDAEIPAGDWTPVDEFAYDAYDDDAKFIPQSIRDGERVATIIEGKILIVLASDDHAGGANSNLNLFFDASKTDGAWVVAFLKAA